MILIFSLSSDKGKPLIILADLYVEAFGNFKEANMVSLLTTSKQDYQRSQSTLGSLAGVTYLRYTVLMSPNKDETAVHCCEPALLVLVMFGFSKRFSLSISSL